MKLETQWTTFGSLPVGKEFWWGGNHCRKKSTRTAWLYQSYGGQTWFYFGQQDRVTADLSSPSKMPPVVS
jgi:hypothetical protein